MQRWRRILRAILALCVLVALNSALERGADRRLVMFIWIARLFLVAAAVGGFYWLVAPFMQAQEHVGTSLALVIFGVLGGLLEVAALAGFLQAVVLSCWGRKTTATVVCETGSCEEPMFEFREQDGQAHRVRGPVSSVGRAYGAGQQLPLIYLPGRPNTFVVDRFGDKWGVSLFFFILGLLILVPWSVFAFDLRPFIVARSSVFGPLMFVLVGGIFCALGFASAIKGLRFRRSAIRTVGVIVESMSRREAWLARAHKEGRKLLTELPAYESGENVPWIITVEFVDTTGTERRATLDVDKAVGRSVYQVGDQQPILFDPGRPWEIQTDTSLNVFGPFAVGLFGAVFVTIGVVLWIAGI